MTRLRAELATCEAALGAAEAECPAESALSESARVLAEALSAEAAGQAALTGLAQAARDSTAEHDMASRLAEAAAGALARLQGEADGLAASLRGDHGNMATALASIEVPAGLEAAIGAALGDASEASLTEAGSHRWRHLDGGWAPPRLPDGSVALASLVTAPAALAKALAHVALLDDAADGDALQAELSPGVVAVNRQGACWRWDGHLTMAGAPNAAAVRLRQRRRLAEARDAAAQAADAASVASARRQEAARVAAEDRANEAAARTALLDAGAAARQAEEAHGRLAARALHATRQRDALQPALERLRTDLQSAEAALAAAAAALERLADAAAVQAAAQAEERRAADAGAALDAARRHYQEARGALAQSEAASTQLTRQAAEIEARISAHMPALAELEAAHLAASAKLADATRDLAGLPEPGRLQALTDRSAEVAAAARAEEAEARSARAAAEAALDGARTEEAALRAAHREAESRLAAVADGARLAKAAADTADVALAEAERAVAALPDLAALQAEESASGVARDEARACAQAAATRLAELESALGQARVALDVARTELAAWQARQAEAEARGEALAAREKAARTAWRALAEAPGDVAARSARSAALLAEAEAGHAALQAKLTAAEQRVRALHGAQRDGEQNAARTREAVVRAEAVAEAAAGAVAAVLARAADRLGPDAQLPEAEAAGDAAEERARRKFERLSREREEMGPVNLRADLELAELDERVAALEREREELGTAIAKLRGAIGHLNREGRERLVAVFNQVDAHFRALFTRMMGGGRAHLAWSGSEDPLLAGLEIYAEPPGKKLSSLSLLSGGEQALTALSLIFAVFRCMPAPVCVLDEVDAPLDDANVERFCALLEDVVRETGTRFLVVTHHQVTMSRMDRLFGVTMQERGVSRLLSVDLRRAVAMVEPILQAAE
jgi:chromosome segregation protein